MNNLNHVNMRNNISVYIAWRCKNKNACSDDRRRDWPRSVSIIFLIRLRPLHYITFFEFLSKIILLGLLGVTSNSVFLTSAGDGGRKGRVRFPDFLRITFSNRLKYLARVFLIFPPTSPLSLFYLPYLICICSSFSSIPLLPPVFFNSKEHPTSPQTEILEFLPILEKRIAFPRS